ncbi:MAG: hypothetical protein Q8R67_04325 [Rhodoferax sp.]|nr:hypothetical protein [Rhodoferax sp.]MDP3650891.1 hypothetical protein [Rhodoferax sp.]
MARIDYIKYRLDNWALWKVRESSGGLGFATQAVFLSEPVDGHKELMGTIEETDAVLTNQAVESLWPARQHLYSTLQLIYIAGIGIKAAAQHMGRAESTIKANLEASDQALSVWFSERAEAKKVAESMKR